MQCRRDQKHRPPADLTCTDLPDAYMTLYRVWRAEDSCWQGFLTSRRRNADADRAYSSGKSINVGRLLLPPVMLRLVGIGCKCRPSECRVVVLNAPGYRWRISARRRTAGGSPALWPRSGTYHHRGWIDEWGSVTSACSWSTSNHPRNTSATCHSSRSGSGRSAAAFGSRIDRPAYRSYSRPLWKSSTRSLLTVKQ
jgi:hypothetical protein